MVAVRVWPCCLGALVWLMFACQNTSNDANEASPPQGSVSTVAAAEPPTRPPPETSLAAPATQPAPRPELAEPWRRAALQSVTSTGVMGAVYEPPPPARPPVGLLEFMKTEIGPRFGRPEARAELVDLLRIVPQWAPPGDEAAWRAIVETVPASGPLYETCKQCHLEQRLKFRAYHGALPVQAPRRPRDRDRR